MEGGTAFCLAVKWYPCIEQHPSHEEPAERVLNMAAMLEKIGVYADLCRQFTIARRKYARPKVDVEQTCVHCSTLLLIVDF